MQLDYQQKQAVMQKLFENHLSPAGFRSTYKAVPIRFYESVKWLFIEVFSHIFARGGVWSADGRFWGWR